MAVMLGINPITWTNDDAPELGGDTPLEVCLSQARQAGFAGIELGGKFPRTATELRPIMRKHGLEISSGWYDGRCCERQVDQEFAAVTPHLTLLRDMGCTHVVYADTSLGRHGAIWEPISRRPTLQNAEWPDYGRKLTLLAERMAEFGVNMAFHHHMGTIVETDAEIDLLMRHTGATVGLLYGSGHSAFAGGDPVALARRHVDRIVYVHCKDCRRAVLEKARRDDMSFMASVVAGIFTVPGDGFIDYSAILQILADAGYSGWLVVEAEQDPRKAEPLTYAMGYDNLRGLAVSAGFKLAA